MGRPFDIVYDSPSYDKNYDKTIDICLRCTRKKCTGECEATQVMKINEERKWYVKVTRTTGQGNTKVSYVSNITKKKCQTYTDIAKVKPFTYERALWLRDFALKTMRGKIKVELCEGGKKNEKNT